MANKDVTIYFYEMKLSELTGRQLENGTHETIARDVDALRIELMNIFNNNINGHNTFRFGIEDEYSLEIINRGLQINAVNVIQNLNFDNNIKYIFGKIGKEKDIVNFQRRNRATLEARDLEKDDDEIFESFTYFYLFFESQNNINYATIAFLNFQSAPGIRKLELLQQYMSNPSYQIKIQPIVAADSLALLLRKNTINSINYSVSLPPDDILSSQIFGLGEGRFDNLRDLQSLDISITLKGKKNKDIFNNRNFLSNMRNNLNAFTAIKNGVKSDITAKAKDDNERLLEYSFLDNKFISKANIEFENDLAWQNEVERIMNNKYMEKRRELLNSLRG